MPGESRRISSGEQFISYTTAVSQVERDAIALFQNSFAIVTNLCCSLRRPWLKLRTDVPWDVLKIVTQVCLHQLRPISE